MAALPPILHFGGGGLGGRARALPGPTRSAEAMESLALDSVSHRFPSTLRTGLSLSPWIVLSTSWRMLTLETHGRYQVTDTQDTPGSIHSYLDVKASVWMFFNRNLRRVDSIRP